MVNERQEQFSKIFTNNEFKGTDSVSGPGSDMIQTKIIREELVKLIRKLDIKIFMDVCGDCNWVQHIWPLLDDQLEKYIGIDIVPEMIQNNKNKYSSELVTFECKDIVEETLPKADLLLCRDVLVHLSFESVKKFLRNFVNSDIKYLLTTTFTKINRKNYSYEDGTGWYPIKLVEPPFNFPQPILLINEECTEGNGGYKDKCLGLWRKEDISKLIFIN